MRKAWPLFIALLLGCNVSRGQGGNTVTTPVSGAPAGTCAFVQLFNDLVNGNLYWCDQGVPTKVNGSVAAQTMREASSPDTILSSDNGNIVDYPQGSTSTIPLHSSVPAGFHTLITTSGGDNGEVLFSTSGSDTVNGGSEVFLFKGQSGNLHLNAAGTSWVLDQMVGPVKQSASIGDTFIPATLRVSGPVPYVDPTGSGATCLGPGLSNDTTALAAALAVVQASSFVHTLYIPGSCVTTAPLVITQKGVNIVGCRGDRPGTNGGCGIYWDGSTPSDAYPYAAPESIIQVGYNQSTSLSTISNNGTDTTVTFPALGTGYGAFHVGGKVNMNSCTDTSYNGGPDAIASVSTTSGTTTLVFAQTGTDEGTNPAGCVLASPYNTGEFDGIGGLTLRNLYLGCADPNTSLLGGFGQRCSGVAGVTDWRGGFTDLQNVLIEQLEYGFWGVQSQIDKGWFSVSMNYCQVGVFMNAESDQFVLTGAYMSFEDHDFIFNGSRGARIIGLQTVDGGSSTTSPIVVGSWYTATAGDPNDETGASNNINFDFAWLEHSGTPSLLGSFVEFGSHDGTVDGNTNSIQGANTGLSFENPFLSVRAQSAGDTTNYLATIGNADRFQVSGMTNAQQTSNGALVSVFDFIGSTSPSNIQYNCFDQSCAITAHTPFPLTTNSGTGSPNPVQTTINNGAVTTTAAMAVPIPNSASPGTIVHRLAKIVSGDAQYTTTSDTGIPVYIVVDGAGESGSASLAVAGEASCTMDATVASGASSYYVVESTITGSWCHPQSSAPSAGVYIVGFMGQDATTSGSVGTVILRGGF